MSASASAEQQGADRPPGGEPFPIVGVGASAGGLEALTELLESLPPNPGLAFLFVSHLEPHHKSHLAEILAKVNSLSVQEATEGIVVRPNHLYLIPPNANMALADGSLALTPRSPGRGLHMPIDHLFRSLASILRERAIGVILSGGGSDGTLGFQSIKAEGGITFAQDEKSARHHSMPRSAILEDCVDYVLSPTEIGRQLARIAQHPYTREAGAVAEPETGAATFSAGGDVVAQIVGLLRAGTDVDFSHYKQSTIRRRILRRMVLRGLDRPEDYLAYLRADPAELHNLYQDFLIRVTQFFRDPEAFEALKEKVFPALLKGRSQNVPVRLWVAGCATGEEVYSLAICLLECLADHGEEAPPVKILATDLSENALEKARTGLYVENIEIDVSAERLRRFFVRVNSHYQITKAVRDRCVFSRHNMIKDPPFSHLDLVSCRNVLIYMSTPLQRRVLPVLHYALKPDGFLFLGASDNIGPFTDLFDPVDARHRIYGKKVVATGLTVDFGAPVGSDGSVVRALRAEGAPLWSALDVQREADRLVLARYAPVGVVVDEGLTVLQFRGRTAPYLEPAPGMASLDLLRMVREGLLAEVRAALGRARAENVVVVRDGVRVTEGSRVRLVRVEIIPFRVPPAGVRFFLVLFHDTPLPSREGARAAEVVAPPPTAAAEQVGQLQQELAALRDYLQASIEERESTNEELKSANEEILSANEELQSTNEELQTAKEEAQSANEELATVNEELRHRNTELAQVNNDLVNFLAGVNIPIVMVNRDLRIRRFTPLAEKLFNLIPGDVGRPLGDIKPNLDVDDLVQRIARVIDTLAPHDSEIRDRQGRWYALRIRPYVTLDNKIDGASVVLLDIDQWRRK